MYLTSAGDAVHILAFFCLFWSRSRQWRRIPQVLHISGCICRFALGGIRKNKKRTKTLYQGLSPFMAEKEGFEPSRQLSHPTPLAGEPLRPLGYFSTNRFWRRERDSNPRCLAASLVFKTSALNHSAISPQKTSATIIAKTRRPVKGFFENLTV